MEITLNGAQRSLPENCKLTEALQLWGYKNDVPIAVAINHKVIPQQDYPNVTLGLGNIIEILMPMQGG